MFCLVCLLWLWNRVGMVWVHSEDCDFPMDLCMVIELQVMEALRYLLDSSVRVVWKGGKEQKPFLCVYEGVYNSWLFKRNFSATMERQGEKNSPNHVLSSALPVL